MRGNLSLSPTDQPITACRRSYRKNEVIEENKALLKEKYSAAKALGKQVRLDDITISCVTD